MNRETAKEEVKQNLEDYLQRMGINTRQPFKCLAGTHEDAHPSMSYDRKAQRVKCFSCEASMDLIDLIGTVEGIEGYNDRLKRACSLYGIQLDDEPIRSTTPQEATPAQKVWRTIEEAAKHIEDREALEYLQRRGISLETAKKYSLGYNPKQYNHTGETWRALIIPTGNQEDGYSYLARNIDGAGKHTASGVPKQLFNVAALGSDKDCIHIVEGEIDALSVIEAGGQAVGLGSVANVEKLLAVLRRFKGRFDKTLILCLDNDKAGIEAAQKLRESLTELKQEYPQHEGLKFRTVDICPGYKDANEALVLDREAFIARVALKIPQNEVDEYKTYSAALRLPAFMDGVNDSANTPAIPTGFTYLDEALDGGLYEGLYTIPAISSLGKTTLALQMAGNIAAQGKDVLYISLEMAANELIAKSLSRHTFLKALEHGIDYGNAKTQRGITTGTRYQNYNDTELRLISEAYETYGRYADRLYIYEGIGNVTAQTVRNLVSKHQTATGNTPVVFVDYLQILMPIDTRATDKQAMDSAALELKRISRDFKTPVVVISSINRTNYEEAISMQAIKESGAIEYGSDTIIGLQLQGAGSKEAKKDAKTWVNERKAEDPRRIEAVILKNRSGRTGISLYFDYYPKFNHFEQTSTPKYCVYQAEDED